MSGHARKYSWLRLILIISAISVFAISRGDAPVIAASDRVSLAGQPPQPTPLTLNIDDQVILPGESFADIVLADVFVDQDYSAKQLTWTISGNTMLSVQITGGIVVVTAPEAWTGSETLHFEACDPAGMCSTDDAVFWVMEDTDVPVSVTFVGNSGFLITAGDTKILIDGLFEGFSEDYALPADEVELLLNAQPPFNDIDLIMATHDHGDHFSAAMVCQHLANDPDAVFVSTEAAAEAVIAAGCSATSIVLHDGERTQMVINGIGLQAMFLSHGDPVYPNYGYTVTVGGRRFFHTGDTDSQLVNADYLRGMGVLDHPLDLAFVPHFYLRSPHSPFVDALGSAIIFPIHYAYTNPPMNPELISSCYPDAVIFSQEMDSWTMPLLSR